MVRRRVSLADPGQCGKRTRTEENVYQRGPVERQSPQTIYKDASAIIVRQGAVQRRVVYNAETKFTIQNKPGSIDDVIVGRQVTCLGSFNDKSQLMATRVEVRSR
jgi:hypothetical protein